MRPAPHHQFRRRSLVGLVTMATVGYGDYFPVTVTGRILAVLLMIGGIAIVGTASATIVTALNDRTAQLHQRRQRELEAERTGTAHEPAPDGDAPPLT